MKINIEVDTYDKRLTTDILGKKPISSGDKRDIYKNTTMVYQLTLKKFSIEEPDTIIFTLVVEGNLATNTSIFATWLYDNLKNRAVKLKINQIDVEIDEEEIKKIINEIAF
ncbi:MAG: hypothetical protein JSW06_05075 [Thermoplasmatales archaeon]|nr:MAG: hypothetical protein JSW06_05075 [Thermoplasmatales archaeon]